MHRVPQLVFEYYRAIILLNLGWEFGFIHTFLASAPSAPLIGFSHSSLSCRLSFLSLFPAANFFSSFPSSSLLLN